jgi:PGF-CTERM protein
VSVISVSDITPTTEATEESEATVQFSIDRDQVENPAQLRVFKETYDFEQQETLWRQLETTVEESTDETVTIEATADSFSLFAIGEVSSVEETGESTTDDETRDGSENVSDTGDGESSDTDDGIPGFGIGAAVAGLLSAAAIIARSRQNDN